MSTIDARGVLAESMEILLDREEEYGEYEEMLTLIADYWTSYLGDLLSEEAFISGADVATMMSLFKIARSSVGDGHKSSDDMRDALGYMAMAADMRFSEGEEVDEEDDLTSEPESNKVFVSDVRFETAPNWANTEESFENMVRKAVEDSDGRYQAGVDVKW